MAKANTETKAAREQIRRQLESNYASAGTVGGIRQDVRDGLALASEHGALQKTTNLINWELAKAGLLFAIYDGYSWSGSEECRCFYFDDAMDIARDLLAEHGYALNSESSAKMLKDRRALVTKLLEAPEAQMEWERMWPGSGPLTRELDRQ